MDTFINWLRGTDDEQHDNRRLARAGWLLITTAGLTVVLFIADAVFVPDTAGAEGFTALLQVTKVCFGVMIAWIFSASLVWPAWQIESWLDNRYPDHAVESDLDYRLWDDLLESVLYGGMWCLRLAVGYAVIAILIAMLDAFRGMADTGFDLSAADHEMLTVLNSFAVATLATLLAGLAFLWLINWAFRDSLEEVRSVETSMTILTDPAEHSERAVTDGGASDGA